MSLVAAADYLVNFREGYKPDIDINLAFHQFMSQECIEIVKTTKKSEKTVDIRPMILEYEIRKDGIFLKLATGSENNLKPELVMKSFYEYQELPFGEFDIVSERLEIYGRSGDFLISLEDYGKDITNGIKTGMDTL